MRAPFSSKRKPARRTRGRARDSTRDRDRRGGGRRNDARDRRDRVRDLRAGARDAIAGLEQRHLDVIGLALMALAIYLGFVLYGGWDGGRVGGWAEVGLTNAVGRVAYVVPFALGGDQRPPTMHDRPVLQHGRHRNRLTERVTVTQPNSDPPSIRRLDLQPAGVEAGRLLTRHSGKGTHVRSVGEHDLSSSGVAQP